jgi:hypothetical protein
LHVHFSLSSKKSHKSKSKISSVQHDKKKIHNKI